MCSTAFHPIRCACGILVIILNGWMSVALGAQVVAPQKHLEITGSERLRITYDSSFVWPGGGGYSAVMDLPIPPDTGGQHIENFTSSLKGQVETDAEGHRLLTATIHHGSGDERRVNWHVVITGTFQTRQLVDGPPTSVKPIVPPKPENFSARANRSIGRTATFRTGSIPPACAGRPASHPRLLASASTIISGRTDVIPTRPSRPGLPPPVHSGCTPTVAGSRSSSPPHAAPTRFQPACSSANASRRANWRTARWR